MHESVPNQFLWECVAILVATLLAMAGLKNLLLFVAKKVNNGEPPSKRLKKAIDFLCTPETLAAIGAVIMFAHYRGIRDGDPALVDHVFHALDWHAAVLVGTLMFQSMQLGRFINKAVAAVQQFCGGNERKFNFAIMMIAGIASCLLSEVAVAAAVTGSFALVNMYQQREVNYKLLVLLAAAVGVGGAFTNFAAPSIVIGANKFDWGTAETLMYLGPIAIISLTYLSWESYRASENCPDSATIPKEPLRIMDWINVALWSQILLFGVFAELFNMEKSIAGMLIVFGISTVANFIYATFFEKVTEADQVAEDASGHEHTLNPILHFLHQLFESTMVFIFLIGLMFMGDMVKDAIVMFGELLPSGEFVHGVLMYVTCDLFSGVADNALAVFGLSTLATGLIDQIAILWGSLTGGVLTIIGNAPNIVVLLLFVKAIRKTDPDFDLSFISWIRYIFKPAMVLKVLGFAYIGVCYLMYAGSATP